MLALTGHAARRWEPKRLRHRLLTIAAKVARTGRTTTVHLAAAAPWAQLLLDGLQRLHRLHGPDPTPG